MNLKEKNKKSSKEKKNAKEKEREYIIGKNRKINTLIEAEILFDECFEGLLYFFNKKVYM